MSDATGPVPAAPPETAAGEGPVALVTGASRGIGLACARALRASGHRVAVTYRSSPPPEGEGFLALHCDQTDGEQVDAALATVVEQLGPVAVLVANAGATDDALAVQLSDERFADLLDTNLTGSFRFVRRVTRGMLRQKGGRIVLVSSVVGLLGSAGQVSYAASKSGMVGLARSLARELGSRGITANVVAPGFVATEMTAGLAEDRRAAILAQVPLGRFASPEEVAGAVAFLAGPAGAYVTGAVIPVDGGLGMGH